jgi:hypothetical protein
MCVWRCRGKVFDAMEATLATVQSAAASVVTEPSVQIARASVVPRVSIALAKFKEEFGDSTNEHIVDICKSIDQFGDSLGLCLNR